jgi:hypothetical protein
MSTAGDRTEEQRRGHGGHGGYGKPRKHRKVVICHVPPRNPEDASFIKVSKDDVCKHLKHDDEVLNADDACEDGSEPICTADGIVCPETPEEVCGDGEDNDGDGAVDEDCPPELLVDNVDCSCEFAGGVIETRPICVASCEADRAEVCETLCTEAGGTFTGTTACQETPERCEVNG